METEVEFEITQAHIEESRELLSDPHANDTPRRLAVCCPTAVALGALYGGEVLVCIGRIHLPGKLAVAGARLSEAIRIFDEAIKPVTVIRGPRVVYDPDSVIFEPGLYTMTVWG